MLTLLNHSYQRKATATYLYSFAADLFDGMAARKYNQCSSFGGLLDMVTDRCSTLGLLFILYGEYGSTDHDHFGLFRLVSEKFELKSNFIFESTSRDRHTGTCYQSDIFSSTVFKIPSIPISYFYHWQSWILALIGARCTPPPLFKFIINLLKGMLVASSSYDGITHPTPFSVIAVYQPKSPMYHYML